ncbi:MAG: hypothetical protein NT162_03310 [Candidatus Woesebacteria bacterium]|nr:hypothetical protein [Candidatus Woesebacteria bacterium]
MQEIFKEKFEQEKPFSGMKVYYSDSIKGIKNNDPEFAWDLVRFMTAGGADVLSEHVAGRTRDERNDIFLKRSGYDRRTIDNPWFIGRKVDLEWVDAATHLIAVVDGPSHGVGMEIQRALDKPKMGLPKTPILCLVREENLENVTWMIRGISNSDSDSFELRSYTDGEDAKDIIYDFLLKH